MNTLSAKITFSSIRALPILLLSCWLCSCTPRGETHTLDQILDSARARFNKVALNAVDDSVDNQINGLVSKMESLLEKPSTIEQQGRGALTALADELGDVTTKAGFTSRPALGQVAEQYRSLSNDQKISSDQVKLLLFRTYSVLAAELETNRFGLS